MTNIVPTGHEAMTESNSCVIDLTDSRLHSVPFGDSTYEVRSLFCRQTFSREGLAVIIAAKDEQQSLPGTLMALAQQTVDVHPVVIDNASKDDTAEVAEMFGATVISEPVPGKMKALQRGIELVLEHQDQATPILFTDADAHPVKNWARTMSNELRSATPEVITGLAVYTGASTPMQFALNSIRFFYANGKNLLRQKRGILPVTRGHNMAISAAHNGGIWEDILALPNYFPGEDIAIRDKVIERDGNARTILHPDATVFTSGDRYHCIGTVLKRLKGGPPAQVELYPDYDVSKTLYLSPHDRKVA